MKPDKRKINIRVHLIKLLHFGNIKNRTFITVLKYDFNLNYSLSKFVRIKLKHLANTVSQKSYKRKL